VSKDPETLKAVPIPGEALRYWVESSKKGQPWVVDLSSNGGNGECICPDFLCRREPALKGGAEPMTRHTCCKHIIAARREFLNTSLRDISDHLNGCKKLPLALVPRNGSAFESASTTEGSDSSERSYERTTSDER
jgi:hypothetical protein